MPPRPRSSKITKLDGFSRGRKPVLSDVAQQELEHHAHYASGGGNINTNSHLESPTPFGPGPGPGPGPGTTLPPLPPPPPQSSPISSIESDLHQEDFCHTLRPPNYQMLGLKRPATAQEVAFSQYGDVIKIDSALCKKVADEIAIRRPDQRREEQKLNIERRSNMEALLAHMTGRLPDKPCKNCHKGNGPWTQCVIYEGQMCGSCTNCWYNASGSRCTFHSNAVTAVNTPANISINNDAAVTTNVSAETRDDTAASALPYYSPAGELQLKTKWETSRLENESAQSSQSHAHVMPDQAPTQPPPNFLHYHPPPPPPMAHPMPTNMGLGYQGSEITHWVTGDPTGRLIQQAMGDVVTLSRRERFLARIESAAEELAMRITEYNEYMRTPEGMSEQQSFQEAAENQFMVHAPTSHHGHATETAAMETASSCHERPMP